MRREDPMRAHFVFFVGVAAASNILACGGDPPPVATAEAPLVACPAQNDWPCPDCRYDVVMAGTPDDVLTVTGTLNPGYSEYSGQRSLLLKSLDPACGAGCYSLLFPSGLSWDKKFVNRPTNTLASAGPGLASLPKSCFDDAKM